MVKIGSVKNSQLELKTVAGWLQFRWVRGNSRTALLFPSNHLSCLQPSAVLVLEGKVAGSSEADVGIKVPPHRGSKPLLNPCSDGTSDGVAVFLSFFFYQFAAWGLGCFQTQTTQSHSHPCWWTGRLRWSRVGHYPTWRVEENPLCPQPGAAGIFATGKPEATLLHRAPGLRPSWHTHTHTRGVSRGECEQWEHCLRTLHPGPLVFHRHDFESQAVLFLLVATCIGGLLRKQGGEGAMFCLAIKVLHLTNRRVA